MRSLLSNFTFTRQQNDNIIPFPNKKAFCSQVGSFVSKYAKLKNVSIITYNNFKGEEQTLYNSPHSMVENLVEKAKTGDGDLSFIPKIRNMFPKNQELQKLLDDLEDEIEAFRGKKI